MNSWAKSGLKSIKQKIPFLVKNSVPEYKRNLEITQEIMLM